MRKGEKKAVVKKPADKKKTYVADLVKRLNGATVRRNQVSAELDAVNSERNETLRLLRAVLADVGIDKQLLMCVLCDGDQPF